LANKLLIKILNNRVLKVQDCGISDSEGRGDEDFPEVRTIENLSIRIKGKFVPVLK
jgi:hypothetical protein